MKIMVAVDDSRHSEQAVEFVTRMRWPAGSRVIVATVVPLVPPPSTPFEPTGLPPQVAAHSNRYAPALIERAESLLRAAGFPTERRIETGDPREALIRIAEDERVDVLVVGSQGRTGITRLLLGSVSAHTVTHAPCSVLVVKGRAGR